LNKLNPGIPVISHMSSHAVPYSERSKWNHFWLIDPLDGEADLPLNQVSSASTLR